MKEVKQIIAENLIALRKKSGLTQSEMAEKLNYSDNTISRWERGDVVPSIEMLDEVAKLYNVPLESLIKENIETDIKANSKYIKLKKLATVLMCISSVWLAAIIAFFYSATFLNKSLWIIFVWAVPLTCLVLLAFNKYYNSRVYLFVNLSILIWSLITAFYLQFISYNLYLIFLIGIPIQMSFSIFSFVRPRKNKKQKTKKQKKQNA